MSEHPKHTTGAMRQKLNNPRYDYMPARVVNDAYGRVATHGAKVYDTDNWKKGLPMSQIAGSLQRHLWAFLDGEEKDSDSGLSHLDHVLWNAVALVFNESEGLCDDRFENRIKKVVKSQ